MRVTIIVLLAAMLISLAMVASATGTISGKVTVNGVAFPGAIVGAKPAGLGGYALAHGKYYAVTDANGDYSLTVDAGDYLVAAWPHCETPYPYVEQWVMSDNVARTVGEGGSATANFNITESIGINVAKTTDGTKVRDYRYNTTDPPNGGASRMNMFDGNRLGGATWYVGQGAWVRRDLGASPPAVGSMVFATDNRRPTAFTIAYSDDDITYTTAFSTVDKNGGYNYMNAGNFYWEMIKLPAPVVARYWKVTIDVSPGYQATCELELYKVDVPVVPNLIKGKVTVNGVAFQGAIVGAKLASSGGYALAHGDYYAVTDVNGNYSLDVAAGDYLVAAWPHCDTPTDPFNELWVMSDNVSRSVGVGATVTADFNITDSLGRNVAKTTDGTKVTSFNGAGNRMNMFNGNRGRDGATWYVSQDAWVVRDLGENPPAVGSLLYATDTRRATAFTIAYSNDDVTYTPAFSAIDTDGGYQYVNAYGTWYWEMLKLPAPVTARYWKVTIDVCPGMEATAEMELYASQASYTGNNVGVLKTLADGTAADVLLKPVTYRPTTSGAPSGPFFYIENPDRSAGIRVVNVSASANPAAGAMVNLFGYVKTDPTTGERYLEASELSADGTDPVQPLGTNTRTIAEDAKLTGELVRVSGTVREVDEANAPDYQWFKIADGYSKNGAEVLTKITKGTAFGDPSLIGVIAVGDFVRVTGVVSKEDPTTKVILLRRLTTPDPTMPNPPNTITVGFEPGEGYATGELLGQNPAWTGVFGVGQVVTSPDPAFGEQSLELMSAGAVDFTDGLSAPLKYCLVKLHVWRPASTTNDFTWWGNLNAWGDSGHFNLATIQPLESGGSSVPVVPSQLGRFVEISILVDFINQESSSWIDGTLVDSKVPTGGLDNCFRDLNFTYGAGTGSIYVDNISFGYELQ